MKKLIMALVLTVGVAWTAHAGPVKTMINLPTAATGIGSTDSLQLAYVSTPFTLSSTSDPAGYFLSVYFRDTVAAAAATDSLIFRLVRRPDDFKALFDSTTNNNVSDNPDGWNTVYSFALTGVNAGNFPLFKHIPLDSTAVYPITAGNYAWMVIGGRTTGAHVMDKAYKFNAYVEYKEAY